MSDDKEYDDPSLSRLLHQRITDAEQVLWACLRNRTLAGQEFRRQHRIGPFTVDFVCLERQLVIELDGGQPQPGRPQHGQHQQVEQKQQADEVDQARTHELERRGFFVLRFWNTEVLLRTSEVLREIQRVLEEQRRSSP